MADVNGRSFRHSMVKTIVSCELLWVNIVVYPQVSSGLVRSMGCRLWLGCPCDEVVGGGKEKPQ